MRPPSRPVLLAAGLLAACAVVYAPSVRFPLLAWDDSLYVASNSAMGHWQPVTRTLLGAFRTAAAAHAASVLLHALNAVLVFLLLRRLVRQDDAAALGAALWALHPLRVEPVAWASGRADLLCASFALLCVLFHLRGERRLSIAAAALAAGSKVHGALLPALLVALDALVLGRGPRWRDKAAYVPAAVLAVVMTARAQFVSGGGVGVLAFGPADRALQAAYGLAFSLRAAVWPVNLGPLYERSRLLEAGLFLAAAVASIGFLAGLLALRKRRPAVFGAGVCFLILLAPALLFKSGRSFAADRYTYLPGVVLAGVAAAWLARAPRPWRTAAAAATLALALAARAQLDVWSSDEALWARGRETSPYSWFAVAMHAEAAETAGNYAAGIERLDEARRLRESVLERAAAARGEGGR